MNSGIYRGVWERGEGGVRAIACAKTVAKFFVQLN